MPEYPKFFQMRSTVSFYSVHKSRGSHNPHFSLSFFAGAGLKFHFHLYFISGAVPSKHRYAEKCKNDPIWQTYNRAYKAHYARYMKKKMTVAEFEKWSRFASDIRDKALAGEIAFEQYYVDIRK